MFKGWKINSIGYGPRILTTIGVFSLAIPLVCYLCVRVAGRFGIKITALLSASRLSFAIGLVLLGLFALLLLLEFIQDRCLDAYYRKIRGQKLRLTDEYYECQYCGFQKVRAFDRQCPVCAKDLQ